MANLNSLQTPLTLSMRVFSESNGLITQAMIDVLNKDPSQVAWINAYNNDLINGARIDSTTGKTWINPATNAPYSVAPFQFESSPTGTSPLWGQITSGPEAGKSAIVFSQNSTFFSDPSSRDTLHNPITGMHAGDWVVQSVPRGFRIYQID